MMAAPALAFEPRARIVRALQFADLADAARISAADVALMGAPEWQLLARAAQSPRLPSPKTRELVATLLQRREATRKLLRGVNLFR